MTILEVLQKKIYSSAEIVEDPANGENSIKFLRNGSIADEIWVAIRDGARIDIYDHDGVWISNVIMEYIPIDYNTVQGYSRLSDPAKKLFESTYIRHNSAQGTDSKVKRIPTKVTEHKDHLKVYYKDGAWLHFYPGGSWG